MAPLGLETREQRGVFALYMSLWVGYGLLNELAKRNKVHFNSASAVLLQSCFKLVLASWMFLSQEGMQESPSSWLARTKYFLAKAQANRALLLKYFIPAGLYVIYDVLSYVNLRQFDASTYFLLLQFRVVITGLLHQVVFQRKLNRNQWIALLVTTLGCAVKAVGSSGLSRNEVAKEGVGLVAYAMLMCQMLSSTFAGIYNELLLKKQVQIPLNLQNVFMYLDSMICTVLMLGLGLTGQSLEEVTSRSNITMLFSIYVFPMVVIMSCIGLVTSMFLKLLDSVRKAIASALELVFLPLLCALFFGAELSFPLFVSVALVAFGVYIYSVPPGEARPASYLPVAKENPEDDNEATESKQST